jgi:hypothetical protein
MTFCCHLLLLLRVLDAILLTSLASQVDTTVTFSEKIDMFGLPAAEWKVWRRNGLEILAPKGFNTTVDAGGNTWTYPDGDLSVAPSGRMPSGDYFFDYAVRQEPIDEGILVRGRYIL